jgi:hypothetical protein
VIPLVAHPSTPGEGIAVAADARRDGACLRLAYRIEGALERVILPGEGEPRRADRLWEHTCVEAFVGDVGSPAYVEVNVAPSRAWAVYAFSAYREAVAAPTIEPETRVRRAAGAIEAWVTLPLSEELESASLRVGLAAVIEIVGGGCTFWALRHPPGRPDFHHADAFALVR